MKTSFKQKPIFLAALVMALCLLLLSGCGSSTVPEGFDLKTVEDTAQSLTNMIHASDYQGLLQNATAAIKAQVTPDLLRDGWQSYFAQIGAFTKIASVKTQAVEENGVSYARTVVISRHEKGTSTFTFVFDAEMKLAGIFGNFQ